MSATPDNLSLTAITAAIRAAALGGRDLWGFDEIAAYCKLGRDYVANVITQKPDFPKPIRVAGARAHPRYIAHQVMTWFESKQED